LIKTGAFTAEHAEGTEEAIETPMIDLSDLCILSGKIIETWIFG